MSTARRSRIRRRVVAGVLATTAVVGLGASVAAALTPDQRSTLQLAAERCRAAGGTPGGIDALDGRAVVSCQFPGGGGWVCDVTGDGSLVNCHYWTTPGGDWHPVPDAGVRPSSTTTRPRATSSVVDGLVVADPGSSRSGVAAAVKRR